MKTVLSFVLPALVAATGIASLVFFDKGIYTLSAVCTLVSYLSASLWVYVLNTKKPALS